MRESPGAGDHRLVGADLPLALTETFLLSAGGSRAGGAACGLARRARFRTPEARMERALRRGLFTLRHTAVIPYMHYASSLRTLRAHVKADWVGAGVDGA